MLALVVIEATTYALEGAYYSACHFLIKHLLYEFQMRKQNKNFKEFWITHRQYFFSYWWDFTFFLFWFWSCCCCKVIFFFYYCFIANRYYKFISKSRYTYEGAIKCVFFFFFWSLITVQADNLVSQSVLALPVYLSILRLQQQQQLLFSVC